MNSKSRIKGGFKILFAKEKYEAKDVNRSANTNHFTRGIALVPYDLNQCEIKK